MRICRIQVSNFRTLENLELDLSTNYCAICGPNDSGKTNVVRAIRAVLRPQSRFPYAISDDPQIVSVKDDFPKWKSQEKGTRSISIELGLRVSPDADAGLFQAISKQLGLSQATDDLLLDLEAKYGGERAEPEISVSTAGKTFSGTEAQEVALRVRSSRSILLHNSTQMDPSIPPSLFGDRDLSQDHASELEKIRKYATSGLAKIAKSQQQQFQELLGKLGERYKANLTIPTFDLSYVPFSVALGDKKFDVPLEEWGSGTRNRTAILLTLFHARQISKSEVSADKTTPLIIIEEPESFLHPSAQADFGRVLQDVADEFGVQVIVTTHSPYMLNVRQPEANVLLRRRSAYKVPRETERVATSGEAWMEPFAHVLGMRNEEFKPWRGLLESPSDAILLVEGETDRSYFEYLRDPAHGAGQLKFEGEIVPYEGKDALKNTALLRFVRNRVKKLFVTFDLDAKAEVEKHLQSLGLCAGEHYAAIGLDEAGRRNIEGLLPTSVLSAVYAAEPALAKAAADGLAEEKKQAKGKLKKLFFEELKKSSTPGDTAAFGPLYKISKMANKALGNAKMD